MNKTEKLFKSCLRKMPNKIKKEIDFSWELSNKLDNYIKVNNITEDILAKRCRVSKARMISWLSGTHKFSEEEKSILLILGIK